MKRSTVITRPRQPKRLGIAPVALSFALILGACSDGSEATSDSPTSTTASTPSTATPSTATGNSSSSTPGSTDPATTASDMDAFLDQLEARGFDGVIAVREGADITTRAFGLADRENDVLADAETVFDIGSLTKQFTAAAILRLEMDGRLSVEDTLGDHLPSLPTDKAAITLHQLLTHTAGVPNNLGVDDEPIDRSEFLARFAETPLASAPGEQFAYSNVGFALLAAVIEFETEGPYEAYLRTALFEPAGMLDIGYVLPDWSDHTIAVGYSGPLGERFGRPNERPWSADGPYWNLHGNGGILSTAADMLRWEEALLGDRVLDATAKAKFFAPHVPDGPDEDSHYGYGWYVVPTPMGTPLIIHSGTNGVFWADLLRFVEQDVAIFLATHSYGEDDEAIAFQVANQALGGALAPMFDDDSGGDGVAATSCGSDALSIDSLPDYPEIATLPDSPAGSTTQALLDLLGEGDAADRLDFATDHVSEELGTEDPTDMADGIADLQDLFAGYEATQILEQDELQFHVLMQGPDLDLLLSVSFDENDPERLTCFAVSTPEGLRSHLASLSLPPSEPPVLRRITLRSEGHPPQNGSFFGSPAMTTEDAVDRCQWHHSGTDEEL